MGFVFDFLGWIAVNVLVPTLAPIIFLLLPKIPRKTRPYSKGLVLKAVQDGQLFWVTIGLCAVGCYELYTYVQTGVVGMRHSGAIVGIVWFAIFSLVSMMLVVLQAMDFPVQSSPESLTRLTYDSGLLRISSVFVLVTAIAVSCSHYLAASATESATLTREAAWRNLLVCLKDRSRHDTCSEEGTGK